MQREAHRRRRPARIGVEHRHHDRHVRPADRDDQQEADDEAERGHRADHPQALVGDEIAGEAKDRDQRAEIDDVAQRQQDRRTAHLAGELEEGDDRAREGDRTDGDAKAHFDAALRLDDPVSTCDAERFGIEIGRPADQHRGQADEAVEGCNQLRHVGHRDPPGDNQADPAANGDRRDDLGPDHPGRLRLARPSGTGA